MIPITNVNTENGNSQGSSPVCQRQGCIHKGTKYSEATRRCTIQLTQKTNFPVVLNDLTFPNNRITVDLCIICYHLIKNDKTFQLLSIVGIGSYAEVSSCT